MAVLFGKESPAVRFKQVADAAKQSTQTILDNNGDDDKADAIERLYVNMNRLLGKDEVKSNAYIAMAKKGHMDQMEKILDTIGAI